MKLNRYVSKEHQHKPHTGSKTLEVLGARDPGIEGVQDPEKEQMRIPIYISATLVASLNDRPKVFYRYRYLYIFRCEPPR